MLDIFSEDQLIQGLKNAYKIITKEFTSLKYLVKVIEDDVQKPKRKLVLRRTKEAEKIKSPLEEIYEECKKKFNGKNLSKIKNDFIEKIADMDCDDSEANKYYSMLENLRGINENYNIYYRKGGTGKTTVSCEVGGVLAKIIIKKFYL